MDRKKSTKDNRNNKIKEYNEKVIDNNKKKQELSTSFSLKDLMLNLKNSRRTRAMVEKCLVELFKYCQKNNIKLYYITYKDDIEEKLKEILNELYS